MQAATRQAHEENGFQAAITEAGDVLGVIGFHYVNWNDRSTSIGYWLAQSAQGRGTMTAAIRALADHAFAQWDLNRVEIRAAPENVRSRAVAERLGFVQEGVLRQAERFPDGFRDLVLYAMLAEHWR